jgi:hypothetical protein
MMLSYTCKTAVKAAVFLATKFESGDKTSLKEILKKLQNILAPVNTLLEKCCKLW